jgi:hypothetical protein
MGTAATRAKRKWNSGHYTNVTAAMKPELAAELKEHCRERGVSVTSVITGLVAVHLGAETPAPGAAPRKKAPDNRGHIAAIEELCRMDEEYLDNIPENQKGGLRHGNAARSVGHPRSALPEPGEAYPDGRGDKHVH